MKVDELIEAVVTIDVMYALGPNYRKQFRPLQELESCQVGRHRYTVLSEILDLDGEAGGFTQAEGPRDSLPT